MRRMTVSCGLFLLGACTAAKGAKVPPAPSRAFTLSIVSTNDVHGQLERLPFAAGFVKNLRKVRAKDGGVLLVDAGDAFQGTIESNLNEGAAAIEAFGVMGYAALSLGNHEFDFGPVGAASIPLGPADDPQGALKQRIAEASFPVLSANLVTPDGRPPGWKNLSKSTEIVVGGVRVGVVGLLTSDAPDVIKRPDFAGLRVTPLAAAATREALSLRARGATVVIVVAHAGGECQRIGNPHDLSSCDNDSEIFRLARDLEPGLVDAIFGGHRNGMVAHFVAGIPVLHVTSSLVAFSRVDLFLDGVKGRVTEARILDPHPVCTDELEAGCHPGDYEGAPVVPDEATLASIGPAVRAAQTLREKPVRARVEAPFRVDKTHEMALGNLFADLMREGAPGADAAFGNAGSVRDSLPAGNLTFGRLLHVMPFDNYLARLHLTGREFRALVVSNLTEAEHGLVSLSGIGVDATCHGGTLEVTLTHPDGAAVRDDEELTVVTNDFMALGGDGLLGAAHIAATKVEIDGRKTVMDAFIEGLERRGTLRPDDPALLDPKRPRMKFPEPFPVRCVAAP